MARESTVSRNSSLRLGIGYCESHLLRVAFLWLRTALDYLVVYEYRDEPNTVGYRLKVLLRMDSKAFILKKI